jgi:estrone sulfotransferase
MIDTIKLGLRFLTVETGVDITLDVFADDVFLIAYPKSGNTWTRFLVGNLVHPDIDVTFLNIPDLIPHIDVKPRAFFEKMARPRVINCHEPFDPRFRRVIYVVRDPRDVAVSLYHYQRKRGLIDDDYPMEKFVPRFIAGNFAEPQRLGSWGANVTSWLALRENSADFLLCRYEDLRANTRQELNRIAFFLGVNASQELLAEAVERSSVNRMQSLEKAQHDAWGQTTGMRKDIPFVRSALVGGWKSVLPERCVAQIESAWGPAMERLGYALSSVAVPPSGAAAR